LTLEEVAERTRLEQEAGRNAVRRFESNSAPPKADFPVNESINPDVELPADVQDKIARGEAARRKFKKSWRNQKLIRPKGHAGGPFFRTSVVKSKELQERRDAYFSALEKTSRRQPHTLFLQEFVLLLVDLYEAKGVPFGTSPNSRMNKLVMEDLNKLTARSRDSLKSRSAPVTASAVRSILSKIKHLLN
jgi:hypothetical protein